MASGMSIDELISVVNPDPGRLSVRVQGPDGGDHARVCVEGELDLSTAGALREALHDVVAQGARHLDVELAGVGFCDDSGLRALQTCAGRLRALGGTLTLHDPCWSLGYLLELFALDETLAPR